MTWCTEDSRAVTTALIRTGEAAVWPPWYCSVARNDWVALAPDPAAVGEFCSTVVMGAPRWSAVAGEEGDVVVADEVGDGPAVQVVLGQAGLGEALHGVGLALRLGGEQQLGADVLVVAGVVALVQLVPSAELGADGVPERL